MRNLYSALGVLRTATKEQIRSKYREQAQRFHPDKPGGDEARFKELQEAYATLGDETRRKQYEDQRAVWLAERNLLGCPTCGAALRKYPIEGVGTRCKACKTQLTQWSASGRLRIPAQRFLHSAADLADWLAAETVEVFAEEAEVVIKRAQGVLFDWLRQQLGARPEGLKRKKKGGS